MISILRWTIRQKTWFVQSRQSHQFRQRYYWTLSIPQKSEVDCRSIFSKEYALKVRIFDESAGVIAARYSGSGNKIIFEISTIGTGIIREGGEILIDRGFDMSFDSPISVRPSFLSFLASMAEFQESKTNIILEDCSPSWLPLNPRIATTPATMACSDRISYSLISETHWVWKWPSTALH